MRVWPVLRAASAVPRLLSTTTHARSRLNSIQVYVNTRKRTLKTFLSHPHFQRSRGRCVLARPGLRPGARRFGNFCLPFQLAEELAHRGNLLVAGLFCWCTAHVDAITSLNIRDFSNRCRRRRHNSAVLINPAVSDDLLEVRALTRQNLRGLRKLFWILCRRRLQHADDALALHSLGFARPRSTLLRVRDVAEVAILAIQATKLGVHVMARLALPFVVLT
mmetsp:Transcript_13705/g.36990  ORF Transcript_13705/g.36990 Transcript_13705/m.36990 type:complete len:220 (+) Transcript_13705:35-694(+)